MVIVKDQTIMVSKGCTFTTLFQLDKSGYVLNGTETITLNVKKRPEDTTVVLSLPCGIDVLNNIISVYATKEEMQIEAGTCFYDVVMNLAGSTRYTLMFPSKFIVQEVCYE